MKKVKNLDILIFAIIIYIEIMRIIDGAYKIDRYNYQHGIEYEYETLGDVGEDLIRKYTSWGNNFFDSLDSWVEEHALYNK